MIWRLTLGSYGIPIFSEVSSWIQGIPPPKWRSFVGVSQIGESFTEMGDNLLRACLNAGLKSGDRILDVGCGIGKLPLAILARYGPDHFQYDGFDPTYHGILWCRKRFRNYPNFRFKWINLYHPEYNKPGQFDPASFRFQYPDSTFDFVVLMSVFTHMKLSEVANYLREIHRVLKPGGRVWASYFLDGSHVAGSVHDSNSVMALYSLNRFSILNLYRSPLRSPTSDYQDLIIAKK